MRRLFTVTAILVLLAPAIGCESCLFRGAEGTAPSDLCSGVRTRCAPSVCARWCAGRRLFLVCADGRRDGNDARPGDLIVAARNWTAGAV